MQISDYRRENFRRFTEQNGGPTAVAKRLGYTNASYVVQMIGPNPLRTVTERTARRVEAEYGLPAGELDKPVAPIPLAKAPEPATTPPEPASVASGNLTNLQVGQLVLLVGKICENEGANLSTGKFADLVALTLSDAAEHNGQVREDLVKTLVHLAR